MEHEMISDLVKAFDGFTISLDDYLRDGGKTLLREADIYLAEMLPEIPEEVRAGFLQSAIHRRCLSILSDTTEWKKGPRGHRSGLECAIGGKTVTGNAIIEPKKITVSMDRDGNACSKECRLLDWAPRLYTIEPFIGSLPNEEGKRLARELFMALYLECMVSGKKQ